MPLPEREEFRCIGSLATKAIKPKSKRKEVFKDFRFSPSQIPVDEFFSDDANAVLIVHEWPYQTWWRRLHSAAWARRVAAWEFVSGAALIPNTQDCFFGSHFTTRLLILRVRAVGSHAGTS